jgi:3-methyl-2-oxobutanoate hydroxymethyltransferase
MEVEDIIQMKITINTLNQRKAAQEKLTMLTCYDASFAALLDRAGVEILLVGDSLGMVIQGHHSTLPVTLTDALYHTACVARTTTQALIVADLPFGTYQASPIEAYHNAAQLMQAGANMVKLEGGLEMVDTVHFLTSRAIPVCAHIGLQPQSVNIYGGYKVQGKTDDQAARLQQEALALQAAGAQLIVFEMIPATVAAQLTAALTIPSIGIGAGAACDGQVLVLHDMLNIYPGKKARFVKNFMEDAHSIEGAIAAYVSAVKNKTFPTAEHSF